MARNRPSMLLKGYGEFLAGIKQRVRTAQVRAVLAANSQMILLPKPQVYAGVRRGLAGSEICVTGCCTIAMGSECAVSGSNRGQINAPFRPPAGIGSSVTSSHAASSALGEQFPTDNGWQERITDQAGNLSVS